MTIVTSAQQLLAGKSPKLGASAANWITSHGGKVSRGLPPMCRAAGKRQSKPEHPLRSPPDWMNSCVDAAALGFQHREACALGVLLSRRYWSRARRRRGKQIYLETCRAFFP